MFLFEPGIECDGMVVELERVDTYYIVVHELQW